MNYLPLTMAFFMIKTVGPAINTNRLMIMKMLTLIPDKILMPFKSPDAADNVKTETIMMAIIPSTRGLSYTSVELKTPPERLNSPTPSTADIPAINEKRHMESIVAKRNLF